MRQLRRILTFKPVALRRVRGNSMAPSFVDGDLLMFSSVKRPKHGDVVVAQHNGKQFVKRLHVSEHGILSLRGDNINDSLDFEDVQSNKIIGSLIYPSR